MSEERVVRRNWAMVGAAIMRACPDVSLATAAKMVAAAMDVEYVERNAGEGPKFPPDCNRFPNAPHTPKCFVCGTDGSGCYYP